MKRLEARLYERIDEFPSKAEPGQMRLSFLTAQIARPFVETDAGSLDARFKAFQAVGFHPSLL